MCVDLRRGDIAWNAFLVDCADFAPVPRSPGDHSNILFSSGTTADPKAIPWTHTTPIRAAADGHLHHDIRPGDVVAWPTSLGWMMGPWLVYATLINRATIALFGAVPIGRPFGEFVPGGNAAPAGLIDEQVGLVKKIKIVSKKITLPDDSAIDEQSQSDRQQKAAERESRRANKKRQNRTK